MKKKTKKASPGEPPRGRAAMKEVRKEAQRIEDFRNPPDGGDDPDEDPMYYAFEYDVGDR